VTTVKLGGKRRMTQVMAFLISNLGLFRVLKTGGVCPFLYCNGCPFALFGCPIGVIQHFVVLRQIPLFTLGVLGIYGVLVGRAFCGWACPFGALHDLINALRGKKTRNPRRYGYVKYVVLVAVLAAAWIGMDTFFCKICPSGSLFAAIPFYVLNPNFQGFSLFFYIHIVTLVATLGLAYVVSHFWCRYLCPLGAIHGAFNRLSLLRIRRDEDRCVGCQVCLQACEMGIEILEEIGVSTDCTLCGRCVEACPEHALSFSNDLAGSPP
jgi:ferredoxin-type protein NapH